MASWARLLSMTEAAPEESRRTIPVLAGESHPTVTPPAGVAVVLVATQDLGACDELAARLADVAHVAALDAPERQMAAAGSRPIIVLDCRPSMQTVTLAAIGATVPRDALVLLWGDAAELRAATQGMTRLAGQWIPCASDATPCDVGTLCASLVGAGRLSSG